MFFRNLTFFRFPSTHDFSQLDALLPEAALKPVGPLELSSRGFVPPFGQHGEALTHAVGESLWLTVGGEDKLLPSSVVNDLLQKKLAALDEKEGRKPGGRTRKRLKEDLVAELLFGDERVEAGGSGKPVGMRSHGGGDQVVLGAVVVDHREGDQEGSIDAGTVHRPEHEIDAVVTAAVPRLAEMRVGVIETVAISHG